MRKCSLPRRAPPTSMSTTGRSFGGLLAPCNYLCFSVCLLRLKLINALLCLLAAHVAHLALLPLAITCACHGCNCSLRRCHSLKNGGHVCLWTCACALYMWTCVCVPCNNCMWTCVRALYLRKCCARASGEVQILGTYQRNLG